MGFPLVMGKNVSGRAECAKRLNGRERAASITPMRVRAKWVAPLLLILSVAVLVLLIPRSAVTRVSLSNGTELRIVKVTQGTNHIFSSETGWKQSVRRLLPGLSLRCWGAAPVKGVTSPNDILVIWVE